MHNTTLNEYINSLKQVRPTNISDLLESGLTEAVSVIFDRNNGFEGDEKEFTDAMKTLSCHVVSFTVINGPHLLPPLVGLALKILLDDTYIVELNLSYLKLSKESLETVCKAMNPVGQNNSIRRLVLTKAGLSAQNVIQLLHSLVGNVTLDELILTGNNCGDEILPALRSYILLSDNTLTLLGLGGNNITINGMATFSQILASTKVPLRHLLLSNNSAIAGGSSRNNNPTNDDTTSHANSMDALFSAIHSGGTLETLNLSNCGIHCCAWSRYLPFIFTLSTVILSHCRINDDEFVKLIRGMETCACIRHLDISYNIFGGTKCCVLQQVLEANQYLCSLNLAGNKLSDSVHKAMSVGLMSNKTLSSLDLSNCEVTLKQALTLCECFQVNNTVTLRLHSNPTLPLELNTDPRAYCTANKDRNIRSTLDNTQYLPLSPDAAMNSMQLSDIWRRQRMDDIRRSLSALSAVADSCEHVSTLRPHAMTEDERQIEAAALTSEGVSSDAQLSSGNRNITTTTTTTSSSSSSSNNSGSDTNSAVLTQSEYYISPAQLQSLIQEADKANTSTPQLVEVCYGRLGSHTIGAITITSSSTYNDVRAMVVPLVQAHLQGTDRKVYQNLVDNFTLFDAQGKQVLSSSDLKLRKVWFEMCTAAAACGRPNVVEIRPANWVQLPPEEDEGDDVPAASTGEGVSSEITTF